MKATLTIEQMRERFPNEWLLVAFTELDDELNLIQGEMLAHSPDRDDIYAAFDR